MAASNRTTSTNTGQMKTYYNNVFLEKFKESLVMGQFVDIKSIPLHAGKLVDWMRYYNVDITTTPITEGSATANQVDVTEQNVQATVKKYAEWAQMTEFLKLTARDPNLEGWVELFGQAAAETTDLLLMTEAAYRGSLPIRADELATNSTHTMEGIVDSSSANSTTRFIDASLDDGTNDWWNGGHFCLYGRDVQSGVTYGNNYGFGGRIQDFSANATTGSLRYVDITTADVSSETALATWASGGKYRIVQTEDLTNATSNGTLSGNAVRYAVSRLETLNNYRFGGGFYHGVLCPETKYDLAQDTVVTAMLEYKDSDKTGYNYVINEVWGVRWFMTSKPYREASGAKSAAVDYAATGTVFGTPIMGRHALGRVDLGAMGAAEIIMKNPGPQDTSQPYNEWGTIAYRMYMVAKALNAAFAVMLYSGATGQV